MKVDAGLWIDHQSTRIVITFPGGEKKLELQSHVEDLGPGTAVDDRGRLNRFYTEIIEAIRDAETILIFGSGEARNELCHHLERARLGDKIIGVAAADPMTVAEIAAKVREHLPPEPVQEPRAPARKSGSPARAPIGNTNPAPSQQDQRS